MTIELDLLRLASHIDPSWQVRALDAIEQLAVSGREFTAYDLIDRGLLDEPTHPNHLGIVFRIARTRKLIKRVDYRPSSRPATRGSAVAVWQGLGV